MKNFYILLTLLVLFSINICEKELTPEDIEKRKRAKEKFSEYLKDLNLEKKKTLTREEVNKIFHDLVEIVGNETNVPEKDRENHYTLMKFFSDKLFDLLATKEKNIIEIEKIMEYFNPNSIKKYVENILKALGLDKFVESFLKPLLLTLEKIFNNYNKVTEL